LNSPNVFICYHRIHLQGEKCLIICTIIPQTLFYKSGGWKINEWISSNLWMKDLKIWKLNQIKDCWTQAYTLSSNLTFKPHKVGKFLSLYWSFGAMANTITSNTMMAIYAQAPCSMLIIFLELYWALMLEVWHALPHTQNPFPFEHVPFICYLVSCLKLKPPWALLMML